MMAEVAGALEKRGYWAPEFLVVGPSVRTSARERRRKSSLPGNPSKWWVFKGFLPLNQSQILYISKVSGILPSSYFWGAQESHMHKEAVVPTSCDTTLSCSFRKVHCWCKD
jgi:hypothetical protein